MIERFALTADMEEVAVRFGVRQVMSEQGNRFNVAPTQTASIIMNDRHDRRVLQESRWGLFPFWAKDAINTDHDTLGEKPFLHRMLKTQRCVIPCSGFYGQKMIGKERDPRAMYTTVPTQPLLAIAGFYDSWRHFGGREERAFTMLTAASAGHMSAWQPKVPIILDEDGVEEWLNPKEREFSRLRKHLEPLEGYLTRSYPVTNAVHDEQYESPDCVLEISIGDFA
ncbi:hypothetical protein A7K91_02095 [Paenibacillus oryzae]|jgi:putative SOS response-associated peptidase YedK|uniref:Abasic site processing protein n=1 Tax=Paenibacillus oryzae TaxID=1844972 RepID=A0A1A5YAM1_9BACL|nr:SOS response-associated peptidase [Paenibacillus oryzae]OBR62430.1 hypothetical protein A7K91_02095 [Paenibacillus oryzae]